MSDYRLAAPLAARVVGVCFSVLAVGVFGSTFVVAALGGAFYWVAVVAVVGVLATGVVAYLVAVGVPCLRLTDDGYRVRILRATGVREGRWADVREVVEQTAEQGRFLVLGLADGASTTIPLVTLRADPEQVVADVRRRVTARHGDLGG